MTPLKGIGRALLRGLGYDVKKARPGVVRERGYEIFDYVKSDGTVDFAAYQAVQDRGNRSKLNNQWAVEENIHFLADYVTRVVGEPSFGICHGTRRGLEQGWFRERLECEVIGTEIAQTAEQFPHTIRWDFHDVKSEWIDAVDFIYSNSFDHSYDPEHCLTQWMKCVRPGGVCIIEHSSMHEHATELDPFGAPISLMPYLILEWGRGRYCVREVLDAPVVPETVDYLRFLVVQRT